MAGVSFRQSWKCIPVLAWYVILHGAIALGVPQFEPSPHNDDWVYASSVERLCRGEGLKMHPLAGALALPQIFVGWVLCKLAGGFSFSLLRGAMVVFGIQNFLHDMGSFRAPSLIPLATYTASVPIAGVLIVLFSIEQIINGWRNGFEGPEDADDFAGIAKP